MAMDLQQIPGRCFWHLKIILKYQEPQSIDTVMVEVWTGHAKYGRINNLKTLFDSRPDNLGDCYCHFRNLEIIDEDLREDLPYQQSFWG